jgi:hypothetical protein
MPVPKSNGALFLHSRCIDDALQIMDAAKLPQGLTLHSFAADAAKLMKFGTLEWKVETPTLHPSQHTRKASSEASSLETSKDIGFKTARELTSSPLLELSTDTSSTEATPQKCSTHSSRKQPLP